MNHHFKSKIFLLPGLWNSGKQHWQTHWEDNLGFERIIQDDWENPICDNWIARIDETINVYDLENVILVGHSLACSTIVFWAKKYNRKIKGALLVAPSDTEGENYPDCSSGFMPMPDWELPFQSILVTSADDEYVSPQRAKRFAENWGSTYIELDGLGHINSASDLEMWEYGLDLLKILD